MSRVSPVAALAAMVGIALFAWTIHQTGLTAITAGIQRLGLSGFLAILGCGLVRMLLRAYAWTRAVDQHTTLPFTRAVQAFMAGDAIGNVTPLGLLASEPIKAAMVRSELTLHDALASITTENLFYTASVVAMIGAGLLLLLLGFDITGTLRSISLIALALLILLALVLVTTLARGWRLVSVSVAWLERTAGGPAWLLSRLDKLRRLEHDVYSFHGRQPMRTPAILSAEAGFHVFAVAEIWITVWLLTGQTPSWLVVFVLEAVNRAITVAFKFVPLRLGVDEAGSELLTRALLLPTGIGVAMAIIRKARVLTLSAVGLWFFSTRAQRPMR